MSSLPQPTQHIGRFQVVQLLGRGTQGSVWLAHDPQLRREVAIKTIEVQDDEREFAVRKLLDEAIATSRLVHPNIVTLFDSGDSGGQPYLVFEFVSGRPLSDVIKASGRLLPVRACEIACQLLRGIDFAHQKGVVHRDLKPGNVMLTEDGTARIMDFGIAALVSTRNADEAGFHGTPAYTAPEYINERAFSARSDVFSMGMMLYEMLTGSTAVAGKTVWELLHNIANTPFEPPSTRAEGIDPLLDEIVMRALAKDPAERYESAGAFREAVEAYLSPSRARPAVGAEGVLDFLMRRIQARSDFPALAGTVAAVNRAANSTREGVAALASTILKDFAFTNTLLKLVNSGQYGQLGRGVSTVSRAIMVLGFDQVRRIASGLTLFDNLPNKAHATSLRDELIATYFAAVTGRSLAISTGMRDGEEAFVTSMFHNLGRLLAAFYFHDEFLELQKLTRAGHGERQAALAVLGLPLDELGSEVARGWNYPDNLVRGMAAVGDESLRPPQSEAERLRLLAALASTLTSAIRFGTEEGRAERLLEITNRFAPALSVGQGQLIGAVGKAVADIARDASTLDLKITESPFFERALAWSRQFSESDEITALTDTLAGAIAAGQSLPGGDQRARSEEAQRRKALLNAGIQDITSALVGKFVLNDLLKIVLDAMYRGGGFARVLLLIRDPASNSLRARFGLGKEAEELVRRAFSIPLEARRDIFHACISQGVDICIDDIDNAKVRTHVPSWYRDAVPGKSMVLLPIMINKRIAALLYGDADRAGTLALGSEELSLLKTLRNQAVLAIRSQHA